MKDNGNGLRIIPERCTGCRQCELACAWVQSGTFQPSRSLIRVHVFDEQAAFAPYVCPQCAEAWCLRVCPVNAIDVAADGLTKIVLDEVCVGCKLCVIACPFGTIFYDPFVGKAVKCDLCAGDPACVRACPTRAIEYGPSEAGRWMVDWGRKINEGYVRAVEGG